MNNVISFKRARQRKMKAGAISAAKEADQFLLHVFRKQGGLEYFIAGIADTPESLASCASILECVVAAIREGQAPFK